MKNGRSAEDIADLATQLRALRDNGMLVSVWLDQHHHRLQSLIPLGWTWNQLADAMNAAGIRYEAGKPLPKAGLSRGRWTGVQLQNAVRSTRARAAKRRAAMQEALAVAPAQTQQPMTPPSPHEAIRRLAEGSKPVVRVFGAIAAEPAQPEAEPGSIQQMVNEKTARTKAIVDNFLKRSKDHGSQG